MAVKPCILFYFCDAGFKRGPGGPRTNWRSTVNKDLLMMGITWEEMEVAAQNRSEWRPLGCGLNQGQGQDAVVYCIHCTGSEAVCVGAVISGEDI